MSQRYVIYGVGGIGGAVGASLQRSGADVRYIQRPGKHLEALQSDGMKFICPEGRETLKVRAYGSPKEAGIDPAKDVVLLTVKSQNTVECLEALRAAAGPDVPVVMAQNGVSNEPAAIRLFSNVYGMVVLMAGLYLNPGEIVTHQPASMRGCLDTGRYPKGVDATATELCATLTKAGFTAQPHPDIMQMKYSKLQSNLGNALNALVGSLGSANMKKAGPISKAVAEEARAVYKAAGIETAGKLYDERSKAGFKIVKIPDAPNMESSSFQSVARGADSIETDFLNGEIVLLGRLHGVQTPANAALQRNAQRLLKEKMAPGSIPVEDLQAEIAAGGSKL